MKNARDFANIWDFMKTTKTVTDVLGTVTDEEGYLVEIAHYTVTAEDGSVVSDCVMAQYPDGTMYPEYQSEIVVSAIDAEITKIKSAKGE